MDPVSPVVALDPENRTVNGITVVPLAQGVQTDPDAVQTASLLPEMPNVWASQRIIRMDPDVAMLELAERIHTRPWMALGAVEDCVGIPVNSVAAALVPVVFVPSRFDCQR